MLFAFAEADRCESPTPGRTGEPRLRQRDDPRRDARLIARTMSNAASATHRQEIMVAHLGLVEYRAGIAMQERLRARRLAGEVPDTLLLLEHPPTYTYGRRSGAQELPFSSSFYEAHGVAVHPTDRGGRVTYHGPGQLVGYPIMAVEDVGAHLRTIEAAIVAALGQAGVDARSRHDEGIDYTGVWVEERKIASIGVHISHGVSTHGFAVNVENELEPFTWVIACGLPDVRMTSLAQEGAREGLACFRKRVAHAFCQAHGARQRLVSARRLGLSTAPPDAAEVTPAPPASATVTAVPA
jgi:lipoate-protein ligase B